MKKTLKRILYGLLVLLALGLIFNKQIAQFILEHFHPKIQHDSKQKGMYDWSKVKNISSLDIILGRLSSNRLDFIGMVAVPKLGVSLPISRGLADVNLSLGAGTMYNNQKMGQGNYALASHFMPGQKNSTVLFSPLYYKFDGQTNKRKIYLTDTKKVYTYKATRYAKIAATDVSVVAPVEGKKLVTLITCNYTADAGRIVLQGELVKTRTWKQTPKKIQKYFVSDNRWIK
ncbi:MAG: class A sortase [Lactobacillaceae bacterium]|jgi:sortase A|nr:class A sortase [Lactobacillaceae bacterium]